MPGRVRQRSSGVEQRFRKPPVVSSNLTAGSIKWSGSVGFVEAVADTGFSYNIPR